MFAEPTAAISIDPKSELEKGKPVTFLVTSHTPVGTSFVGFDTYSLHGTTFSNPVHGAGAPPATFTITFDNPGTYTVYVTGDNDAGGLAEASRPRRDRRPSQVMTVRGRNPSRAGTARLLPTLSHVTPEENA